MTRQSCHHLALEVLHLYASNAPWLYKSASLIPALPVNSAKVFLSQCGMELRESSSGCKTKWVFPCSLAFVVAGLLRQSSAATFAD